jgi:hypothetical protein
VYVNTIFVPDLEPTRFFFSSTCDTMYVILFFIIIFYFFVDSMYVFLFACSVFNIQLFHGFVECLNTIQYNALLDAFVVNVRSLIMYIRYWRVLLVRRRHLKAGISGCCTERVGLKCVLIDSVKIL